MQQLWVDGIIIPNLHKTHSLAAILETSIKLMCMKVFENDDKAYLKWIKQNPFGFVVNTRKEKSRPYRVAHKVLCKFISNENNRARSTENYIKVCATDPIELKQWFHEHKNNFNNEFHECGKCQPNINVLFTNDSFLYPIELDETPLYQEGSLRKVFVNKYERDPQARKDCLKHFGHSCSVCKIDFSEKYGELGKNFIHVHHLKPLSEIKKTYTINPITDLIPVCPNCHSMLHRRVPALQINELKSLLK